ncbi:unnamed protein product, partial [marine sediment metagenome]
MNIIEKEQEEIISVTPPDNYHLININNLLRSAHENIFKVFFNFLTELWIMVNDPENPRITNKIENGKVLFKYELTSTEFEKMNREITQYNEDKMRQKG